MLRFRTLSTLMLVMTIPLAQNAGGQLLIDDFASNSISPQHWTSTSTKGSVQIDAANQRLEFSSQNDSAVTPTELNLARVSSVWGIGTTTDFRLRITFNFVPQTSWRPAAAVNASQQTGVALHITTVDTAIPVGSVPDGILLTTGTAKDADGYLLRYVQLARYTAGNSSRLYEASSYGDDYILMSSATGGPVYFPIGTQTAFLRYQASSGKIFISFSSFDDPQAISVAVQSPSARRPLRISLGGFTVGTIRALGGSFAWFDDIRLDTGSLCYRPTGLQASSSTEASSVSLSWQPTPGATKYYVYRENGIGTAALLPGNPITTTTYLDTSATPGVQYRYLVRAESPGGVSESSAFVSGSRRLSPPAAVTATDGSSTTGVSISWSASTGATSYAVFRSLDAAGTEKIGTVLAPGLAYNDTTASPGVAYSYTVAAGCSQGESVASAPNTGYRGLSAPLTLSASDGVSTERIMLSWTPTTGATRYRVFRGVGSASTEITPASLSITSTEFTDSTAVPGVIYTYAVKAVGPIDIADSAPSPSNTGYRALSSPSGLVATDGASGANVSLAWTGVSGASRYKVFRGIGSPSTDITPASPAITSTTFNDISAVPGTIYTYAIRAVGPSGVADSPLSATDLGHRAIAGPTNFTASDGASTSGVQMSWSAVTSAARYKVYRGIGSPSVDITPTSPAITNNSFADLTAQPGVIYTYAVRAVGATGVLDSATSPADVGHRALAAPSGLSATDGTSTDSTTLAWTGVAGATRYKIFRGIGSASADITPAGTTITATSFTDPTAAPGVVYTYAVKAAGPAGVSDSAPSTTNTGYRAIAEPASLTASDGTSTAAVTLSWTAATGATRYRIFRGIDGASTDITPTSPAITALTFNDTSAVPGTLYTYAVKAVGPTGVADSASSVTNIGYRALSAPGGLLASDGTNTEAVNLTWATSTGATRYKIFRGVGSASTDITPAGTAITSTSFSDMTASPGVVYTYAVKAAGSTGITDSVASAINTGYRALLAPTDLAASDGTSTAGVTLSWTGVTGTVRYKIFRGIGSASADITPAGTTITATSFTDPTAAPGVVYTYAVKAVGPTGVSDSAPSTTNTGYRAIAEPASLTASDGTSTAAVTLSWTAATGATRYRIFRGIDGASTDITPTSPAITALTFNDTSAVPGTLYTYAVKAVGPTGVADSASSVTNIGYRALSAPGGLLASDGTNTEAVNLTWATSTGATRYKIFRGVGSASTDITPAGTAITSTSFSDMTASPGVVYTYAVKAAGSTGITDSVASAINTGYRAITAPTSLSASDSLTTKVSLSWSAVVGASGYRVYRGTSGSALVLIATVSKASHDDLTAAVGTIYFYAVKAIAASGDSALSATDTGIRVAGVAPSGLTDASGPNRGGVVGRRRIELTGSGSMRLNPTATGLANVTPLDPGVGIVAVYRYLAITTVISQKNIDCTVDPLDVGEGDSTWDDHELFIDLDEDSRPDLCQLLEGDFDLDGSISWADLTILLTMVGTQPVQQIGDFDRDGDIKTEDVQALLLRLTLQDG